MRRRVLVAFIAAAVGAMGLYASFGAGGGTPAKAADITHSRWANRISGYIMQDVSAGTQGQARKATNPKISSGVAPPTVGTTGCSQVDGNNVRVNQDCTNNTVSRYAGRGQAQNETAIAANPLNGQNVIGTSNDYRRGDGSCGASFSLDGGAHWGSGLLPIGFSVGGVDNPSAARHYWTSSGDPSVAFDTRGAAYYSCGVFDRSFPTNDTALCSNPAGSCASGIFIFRSVDGGASWNFPSGVTGKGGTGQVIATPGINSTSGQFTLEDKMYLGIDAHTSSPYRDHLYEAWTHYAPCGTAASGCETANIYFSSSSDHGTTFSAPKSISGSSTALCTTPLNPATPHACDNNQFSQPVVAANGDIYVFFANYNNPLTSASDNHNNILVVKSTNGGATFGPPALVSQYYDLPDCATYTGDDAFRSCVPTAPLSNVSVFRAANYPSAAADPTDPHKIYVTFGSFINVHSNPTNATGHGQCTPAGLDSTTFLNLFTGVGDVNGCNNDIVLSTTSDGGNHWSAATSGVAHATVVNNEAGQLADQWFQWAATNSAGTLAVSYYDRQYGSDQNDGSNDVTLAASHPSGFAHARVTNISIPPYTEFPGMVNGYSVFAGDYSGLALSGTTAYPMWTDSRDQEFFQCPSNSDPLGQCRVTNGNVPGFDEDVFTTIGLALP